MMKYKNQIPRLLSGRNTISRLEKEQVLENILNNLSSNTKKQHHYLKWAFATGLCSIIVLGTWAAFVFTEEKALIKHSFTTRGGSPVKSTFVLRCNGNKNVGICKQGNKLIFDISVVNNFKFFVSFARISDEEVVWYFPEKPNGKSIDLSKRSLNGILDTGIMIGKEHPVGTHNVYGIFSDRPLTRTDIKDVIEKKSNGLKTSVRIYNKKLIIK